jgi:4-amino-4-deoxy-L-arabinose transferase-like glycosyltransferase
MIVWAWVVVAVVVRVLVWLSARDAGVFADMSQYHERALALLSTGTIPDALRGPGYPLALAAAYATSLPPFDAARLMQALLGGVLTWTTARLAEQTGAGARRGWAAAVVALYPGLVLSSVYLMPEGLYTTLAMVAVWLVVAVDERSSAHVTPRLMFAGALAGMALLTRSVGLALLPAMLAAVMTGRAFGKSWLVRVRALVLGGAVMLAVVSPWLLFTTRVAGAPMLDTTSGLNLLIGNHPGTTGRLEMDAVAALEDQYLRGAATPAEASRLAVTAGVTWAVTHPVDWLRVSWRKVQFLFGLEGREHVWVYSVGYFGARVPWVVACWGVALLAGFPLLCLAALAGLGRGLAWHTPTVRALALLVVGTTALHVMSFGESRFHLPLIPALAVMAVSGAHAHQGRGARPVRTAAAVIAAALLVTWMTQLPDALAALQAMMSPDGWRTPRPY